MAATADKIPSDLTLEIGANTSPEQFLAAVKAFFGYVEEVAKAVAPEGDEPTWTVHVREGSALVAVTPNASVPADLAQVIYSRAETGIKHLLDADIEGANLPEPALRHLRTLSDMTAKGRGLPLRVWVKKKPLTVDQTIARVIREDWQSDYSDFGTIEGRLQTIQERGQLEIQVRDAMFKQTVRCVFPEEMLAKVFENFRRRVEVSGVIHFRKNGTPISIEASDIIPLPEEFRIANSGRREGHFEASVSADPIYWDSDAFLGWLQAEPGKVELCQGTIDLAEAGDVVIVTSALTLAEVLWMKDAPKITKDKATILRKFFRRSYIRVRGVSRAISELAQDLVWDHGIKPKDAIHVATAIEAKCDVLETFDRGLLGKSGKIALAPALVIRKPIPPREPKLDLRTPTR